MTPEANIEITRKNGKVTLVSVSMPVWTKWNDTSNILEVKLPLLGLDTVAKDDKDAEKAIEEAIASFCVVAERFGQGLEKELEFLGWKKANESMEFDLIDSNPVLEKVFETGDSYVNNHIVLQAA